MITLTVIEPDGANLSNTIKQSISYNPSEISINSVQSPDLVKDGCDVLVVSTECTGLPIKNKHKMKCGALLLPGGFAPAPINARYIVTYGMGAKNTLTLSSIGEKHSILALQREVPTINGEIIERQEMKIPSAKSADETLAATGSLLLLGFL